LLKFEEKIVLNLIILADQDKYRLVLLSKANITIKKDNFLRIVNKNDKNNIWSCF